MDGTAHTIRVVTLVVDCRHLVRAWACSTRRRMYSSCARRGCTTPGAALFLTLLFSWLPWIAGDAAGVAAGARLPPAAHGSEFSTWAVHLAACASIGVVYAAWIALLGSLAESVGICPGP